MKYNIKIDNPDADIWKNLSELGIYRYSKYDGLIYKYVSFETAIKIIEGNCLQYSQSKNFNDPFDLTNSLLDTSISRDDITKLITEGFITTDEERQKIIDYNLANPDILPSVFLKTLDEAKAEMGITCFSKSPFNTLMWSHYANKHSGICLGFCFNESGGNGLMQLAVGYANEIKPRNYFKETIFSIYNWIYTKSAVWKYEEEVRRTYINKNGLIEFEANELREIYYGVNITDDQIEFFEDIINRSKHSNIQKRSRMKINPKTFDIIEKEL